MSENQIKIIDTREVELLEKQRKVNLQKLFTPEGMDSIITTIKKEISEFKADVSTKEGRAAIVSKAAQVARCKSPIEKLAKEAKDESQRIIAGIQTEWKRYEGEMDTLRDEIRKPVDEIEEKEAGELAAKRQRVSEIESYKMRLGITGISSKFLELSIREIKELAKFDWQDFSFMAENLVKEVIERFEQKLEEIKKAEIAAEELAQLKKEKAERDQKDHEAAIAAEAAEKAKLAAEMEAEKKAKAIREAAEAEKARIEAEKLRAEEDMRAAEQTKINAEIRAKEAERMAAEREFIQKRESDLFSIGMTQEGKRFVYPQSPNVKLYISSDEIFAFIGWDKKLAELKNAIFDEKEKQKIVAEKKAKEDVEKAAAEAVEEERKRVEEEERKENEATEKREKNRRHCAKINNEALEMIRGCINGMFGEEAKKLAEESGKGIDYHVAKIVVQIIAEGRVPHVQINY